MNSRLKNIEAMLQLILKKEASPEDEDRIDVEEAAKLSNLSTRSIYNYVSNGKMNIPYKKQGSRLSFLREDVIRWNLDRSYRIVRKPNEKIRVSL